MVVAILIVFIFAVTTYARPRLLFGITDQTSSQNEELEFEYDPWARYDWRRVCTGDKLTIND